MTPTQWFPRRGFRVLSTAALATTLAAFGCTPADGGVTFEDSGVKPASGGATVPGSGGASSGGAPGSGGAANSGGAPGSGGRGSGGASQSGGASGTGGRGTGGSASGGSASGGSGNGGRGTGGSGTGGRGGSSGTGGAGGGSAATFSAVAMILGTSCGTGTCHMGGAHVDLRNTTGLRDRIVSKMVTGSGIKSTCASKTYIVPNDTATSLISQIIKAQVGDCGARMPDNCSTSSSNPRACLTTAQIATIDAWITAGAPP